MSEIATIYSSYYYCVPYIWYQSPPPSSPQRALAHFIETRRLRQARLQLEHMDPAVKSYLDKLSATMEANTTALTVITSRLDDLAAWRPDLEKCVADLGEAVAALQQGRPGSTNGEGTQAPAPTAPLPATRATASRVAEGAAGAPHGSIDHGEFHLQRGSTVVSSQTPPPLPTNGQLKIPSPNSLPSPFAHASQMLAGLGQAHPSIAFPQFSRENPNLWKTMCEQYFNMFGIHEYF